MARRRPFIAANWKMHKTPVEAETLAMELKRLLSDQASCDLVVAPPYICIPSVVAKLKHSHLFVAAQDLHAETQGAFTGAVSGEMLRAAGCTYVLVGHSERRSLFGDDDTLVARKLRAAFRSGLLPILCVGETLSERDGGKAAEVVVRQLHIAMGSLPPDQAATVTIAYEPVWAIGTGRTATAAQAQEMHATIRAWLRTQFPSFVQDDVRILYGGSVKADNAAEILGQADVDGALVGGASLQAESFAAIVGGAPGSSPG